MQQNNNVDFEDLIARQRDGQFLNKLFYMHDIQSKKNKQFHNIKIKSKPERRLNIQNNSVSKQREQVEHEPGQEITPVVQPNQEDM